nr:PREDICTED: uncharacterized protein LOC106702761 isoform X2 [Latimeria chalumnae]|eukprot:XP_014341389.1 PREDICTED: uncharacterized protein LOC106702761 isoform X2 [Latimeria chalumnae]
MAQAATHNRMNDLTTLQKTQSRNMNCSIGFGYECPDWRTENKNYENTMRLIGDVSDTRGSQRFLHRGDLTCKFDKVLYNSDIVFGYDQRPWKSIYQETIGRGPEVPGFLGW